MRPAHDGGGIISSPVGGSTTLRGPSYAGGDSSCAERCKMTLKTVAGLALIVLGAVALYFGWQASDAPLERARESLTGDYSDSTMLHLIGGCTAVVVGLALLFIRGR
jgi:Protein of unknown function (DUF3185)